MKYRLSILNVTAALLILVSLTTIFIRNLYDSQVTIFTTLLPVFFFGAALVSLHLDFFLQYAFKSRKLLNYTEGAIALITLLYLVFKY